MGAIVGGAEMNMAGRCDRAVFPSSFIILYSVELRIYIIHYINLSAVNV